MSDKKTLPESKASRDGANAAAMQDAKGSDLDRGYTTAAETHRHEPMPAMSRGGFLGRSGGWER